MICKTCKGDLDNKTEIQGECLDCATKSLDILSKIEDGELHTIPKHTSKEQLGGNRVELTRIEGVIRGQMLNVATQLLCNASEERPLHYNQNGKTISCSGLTTDNLMRVAVCLELQFKEWLRYKNV